MFNAEFFSTPPDVAERLFEPYREKIQNGALILDPSAGAGDLLRFASRYGAKEPQLFAVEVEPELTAILRQKKFRVIGSDFLRFESQYLFDLIVMNPPFSNGDDHLLQAWEILREGDIACLLNAETIKNAYTDKRRLLLNLIQKHGTVEFIGQAFKRAQRPTDVEVALVRLSKTQERPLFEFVPPDQKRRVYSGQFDEGVDLGSQVAKTDLIEALVHTFQQVGDAYENFMVAREKLNFYVSSLTGPYFKFKAEDARPSLSHIRDERQRARAQNMAEYNAFMDAIKFSSWQRVFDLTKIREVLTASLREEFNKYQQEAGSLEFSEANIWAFFEMLINNRGDNMRKCVVEVFDRLTSYDEKNKVHYEGWKTNSAYKVNQKVILPYFIEFNTWGRSGSAPGNYSTRYQTVDRLRDIDRVMCMLSGKPMNEILTIEDALTRRFQDLKTIQPGDDYSNEVDSEFFSLKFWKKGTLHMTFRDPFLWREFNLQAAKGKNWLGDGE